jgi:hypothetical protein
MPDEVARIIDSSTPVGPKPMEPVSSPERSCVSEAALPASDQHLYGLEGNHDGNAVEKRPHHKGFLSA